MLFEDGQVFAGAERRRARGGHRRALRQGEDARGRGGVGDGEHRCGQEIIRTRVEARPDVTNGARRVESVRTLARAADETGANETGGTADGDAIARAC